MLLSSTLVLNNDESSVPAKDEAVWRVNCGRGVHHLCSWLPLMQQFELLMTTGPKLLLAGAEEEAEKSSSPAVQHEKSSSPAVPQKAESRPAEIKKTAYSWAGSSEQVDEAFQASAAPSFRRALVFHAHNGGPWVLQAFLLALPCCQGVTAVGETAAVPDQCDWVGPLCSHADRARARSHQTFKDFLDYAGLSSEPPEYGSIHLCIWGSSLLPEDTIQQLSEDHAKACMLVLQYKLQHGMWPHPLTVPETMAAKQKAASSCPAVQGCGETAIMPGSSCPAVRGPQMTAEPATSSAPAPGTAGPKAQNCISRGGTVQKCPAAVRTCKCSKSSQ